MIKQNTTRSGPRPVLLGYQNAHNQDASTTLLKRLALEQFARVEGYDLAHIFVENDRDHPGVAFEALVARSSGSDVEAVAVPSPHDLGAIPRVQQLTLQRMQDECDARIVVIADEPPKPEAR
jgi:hypothetical protein